jgi:hypothetical protein
MRIRGLSFALSLTSVLAAGAARAATVGDEIVLPAGSFCKDSGGIVKESGGYGGTGVQAGTLKFPENWLGGNNPSSVMVGISTLLPADWVGHDVDIVFGGASAGLFSADFRIVGEIENNPIGLTATLGAEDWGTTDVTLVSSFPVTQRRFGIAIGREPGHAGDTALNMMNLEYLVLRLAN